MSDELLPPPLQRHKLTIAYRGTHYHGWQRQSVTKFYKGPVLPGGKTIPTVQELVEKAIKSVVRHPIRLVGSSRTDAGVHAKGQLAHFDTHHNIPVEGMRRAINHALPDDILIRAIEPVSQSFSAVMSTTTKRYQYLVWNALDRPLFSPELAMHRWQPLDLLAMKRAAARLVGTHDFASFARPGHKRASTVRTILAADVSRRGPRLVIGVEGNGFLWNMVRIIAGTLIDVGMGSYTPEQIDDMLAAKDRRVAGQTAPAHGLYLHWIKTRDAETEEATHDDVE